jgi:hypothetical protein
MKSALTEVFRTWNVAEADMMRSRLRAAGLDASIQNDQATLALGWAGLSGGIRVLVPSSQHSQAKEVLEQPVDAIGN